MKPELDNQSVHRYMRVYNYYKQLILSQQLAPGSRLPSIRRCAAELQSMPYWLQVGVKRQLRPSPGLIKRW